MLDNPQSKLNKQYQQLNPQGLQQKAQNDIDSQKDQKPFDTKPNFTAKNLPNPDPPLQSAPQSTLKDAQGNEIEVPEQKEEGFAAKLKRKIKEKATQWAMNKVLGYMQPEQKEADTTQPRKDQPRPNMGQPTPQPHMPQVQQPRVNPPQPTLPKPQLGRMGPPPRPTLPRFK